MKKIVFLTGAGISAESGISTFRGGGGLWDNYPVEQVATPEGYHRNPSLVLEFYNKRRRQLLEVEPNDAHRIVAGLEKSFEVTVITQNVDDLHERGGSTDIIHLHGELMKVCSSREPYNEAYVKTLSHDNIEIKVGDRAADGSQLRPFIVWFGESVPRIEDAIKALKGVDAFVIVGTSMNVYPAAGLLSYVPYDVPVFLIDPNEVHVNDDHEITVIQKGASEGMRILADEYLSKLL